ncbi:MAG: hypothetical protein GY953_28890, partial [bacterium]|nr:hypothetical protein [bacterium]
MKIRRWSGLMAVAAVLYGTVSLEAQQRRWPNTMRPVIRGVDYAVSTRTPQATQAGEQILRAGGNAFDAAVASQAALAVTDPASNGVGSDAFLLVYDSASKKVISINAGGTAPRLATIDWYKKNH